jgi:hypothetical protein
MMESRGYLPPQAILCTDPQLIPPTASVAVLQETSAGIPSWRRQKTVVFLKIVPDATDVNVPNRTYFFIPSILDGKFITSATAFVVTAGDGGVAPRNVTMVKIRNATADATGAWTIDLSIPSGSLASSSGSDGHSVTTNTKIAVYVTTTTETRPKGLYVVLEFS